MKHRILINSPETRAGAIKLVENVDVHDKPYELLLHVWVRDRSVEQNNLYWEWVKIICETTGYTKAELHNLLKEQFLVPILLRDDKEYADSLRTWSVLRSHREVKAADDLAKLIKKMVTTTHLNTKQFSEYLSEVFNYGTGLGVVLPEPENKKDNALN